MDFTGKQVSNRVSRLNDIVLLIFTLLLQVPTLFDSIGLAAVTRVARSSLNDLLQAKWKFGFSIWER